MPAPQTHLIQERIGCGSRIAKKTFMFPIFYFTYGKHLPSGSSQSFQHQLHKRAYLREDRNGFKSLKLSIDMYSGNCIWLYLSICFFSTPMPLAGSEAMICWTMLRYSFHNLTFRVQVNGLYYSRVHGGRFSSLPCCLFFYRLFRIQYAEVNAKYYCRYFNQVQTVVVKYVLCVWTK